MIHAHCLIDSRCGAQRLPSKKSPFIAEQSLVSTTEQLEPELAPDHFDCRQRMDLRSHPISQSLGDKVQCNQKEQRVLSR